MFCSIVPAVNLPAFFHRVSRHRILFTAFLEMVNIIYDEVRWTTPASSLFSPPVVGLLRSGSVSFESQSVRGRSFQISISNLPHPMPPLIHLAVMKTSAVLTALYYTLAAYLWCRRSGGRQAPWRKPTQAVDKAHFFSNLMHCGRRSSKRAVAGPRSGSGDR